MRIPWLKINNPKSLLQKTRNERKKGAREKRKEKKNRVHISSTCKENPKQYITNCPELRRLQFTETDIFNIF